MTTLNYSFTAGQKKRLPGGKSFKIESSTADVTVTLYNKKGTKIDFVSGMGQGDGFVYEDGFHSMEMESATAQSVECNVTDLVMTSNNLVGNISALTTPDNLAKNGVSFFGGFESNAVASNYSFIGLRNPIGSGITVYVENIMLGSTGNTVMLLRHNANGISDVPVFTLEHNKQLFGARANARVQTGTSGISLPVGGAQDDVIGTVPTDTQGSVSQVKMHGRPIELSEGEAIAARGIVVNTNVAAFFEWFEE